MERLTQFRAHIFLTLFAVLLGFFAFTLYDKQIYETGGVIDNSTTYTTWTRVKAARGDILDRNGNILVGNRSSYDIVINHYVLTSSNGPNKAIYDLVKVCQEWGIEYTDRFPISKERPFTYTLDEYNSTWQNYFQLFLQNRGELDSDISAPLLIEQLRKSYFIPEEWTDEEARMVLGIRYELTLRNCTTLSNYVFIEDASDEARAVIQELNVPGLTVEASTVREYHTEYAAHILGYVGAMDKEQWDYYKTIDGYMMDAEVGQSGLEKAFEPYLRAIDGIRIDTVTPDGTIVSSRYEQLPVAGNNVEITIDIELQQVAEDELAKTIVGLRDDPDPKAKGKDVEGGAVVVMDPNTGQILACASYPTYDLATFRDNYDVLAEDPLKPMYNRAFQAAYPPGSTYKMTMLIAATQAGVINMESKIEDKGEFLKYWETAGFKASCLIFSSTGLTHGFLLPKEAICVSCNYFFYELSDHELFSWEFMDEAGKGLGLGEPTGIELSENTGRRANPETKKKLYDKDHQAWTAADNITSAIGQNDHRYTPLQLCVYASTLATGGTRYSATFLNRVVSTDYRSLVLENLPEIAYVMDIPQDAIASYMEGMEMVAHFFDPARNLKGTGFAVFENYPIRVCAKTGTAQTGINNQDDNGAFLCFAPADKPEIAIAVYGEKAGSGSVMGWVARGILDAYFDVGELGELDVHENAMS